MTKRGLIIGSFNTAEYGFTMSKLHLEVPQARQDFVEVDGMSGALDYSDAQGIVYQTCRLEAVFELSEGNKEYREKIIGEFIRAVHGKSCPIIHPDHGGKILTGRVQLSKDYSDLAHAQVSMSAVCQPWFTEPHDTIVSLPVRDRSYNCATFTNIELMEDLTTCQAGITGDTESVTVGLVTVASPIHSKAVFRIKLNAAETYVVSGRLIGRGFWRASATQDMPSEFTSVVHTGDDGYLYISITRLQSYGAVTLTDLVIVPGYVAGFIENGSFPVTASVQAPSGLSVILAHAGTSSRIYQGIDIELPAGDVPAVAFCISSDGSGDVTLKFRRRWLE